MGGVHVEVCSKTLFCVENCRTDVTPVDDDDTVDVNDLLAIINNWGPCPKPETLDQDVQDCMDYATNELELEPYTRDWLAAVDECVKNAYNLP